MHVRPPNHAQIDAKIHCFSECGFCRVLMCFGVHMCDEFCCFSGLAATDRENIGYVTFDDSIEKLADFHEN